MRRSQNINLSMYRQASVQDVGGLSGASQSGTTDDAVLRFAAVTVTVVGRGVASSTVAPNGTIVAISAPGLYLAELAYTIAAGTTVVGGISLNVAVGGLNTAPAFATAGMRDVLSGTAPAATVVPVKFSTLIPITMALASVVGGALVRFHGTDAAGATPAGITTASAYYRVTKIAELYQ